MIDLLSWAALALVAALLSIGLVRQFAVSNPFWVRLDQFGIVPQWKFFAQARIDDDQSALDDMHLLVRVDDGGEDPGPWQPLLWWGDRTALNALWNSHGRSSGVLGEYMQMLALSGAAGKPMPPTALAYLTVLRHCLDSIPADDDQAVQFAIVLSRGRIARPMDLAFLSAWHCR